MELPSRLRQAVNHALKGIPLAELATSAEALSQSYREGRRDGTLHVAGHRDALAYLAVRLPATYPPPALPRLRKRARILRHGRCSILAQDRGRLSGRRSIAGPVLPT